MKRIKLVVAVAAMMSMSVVLAVPAMADDGSGESLEERVENRIDNYEDPVDILDDRYDVDIEEDVTFFGSPFLYYYGVDAYEEVLDEVFDIDVDLD